MSSVFIPRPRKTSISSSPKSPPTTATTRTSEKKLAESEKCVAEPPSILSRLPNGVSTASNATEPTTSNDTFDVLLIDKLSALLLLLVLGLLAAELSQRLLRFFAEVAVWVIVDEASQVFARLRS